MRAIRVHKFGGPEVLEFEEIPDPKPDPAQVRVRINAIGVNPVDTYIRSGRHATKPALPYTPGTDAAGIVESIGEGVTRVQPGDRVYTAGTLTGAYAEAALCSESQLFRLPPNLSFAQGAALNVPYATAHRALFHRAGARAGEVVLVHGASGGVGVAAVQLARAAGLTIIGTAGTASGSKLVSEQGAHHVLDHHDPAYRERIIEITGGRGVDLILEMLANVNLNNDLGMLARHGRVVVIGSRGTIEIDPRLTMTRDTSILGMSLINLSEPDRAAIHQSLSAGLEDGTLRPVVGAELPLSEAARAHEKVLEPGAHGKIVLIPAG